MPTPTPTPTPIVAYMNTSPTPNPDPPPHTIYLQYAPHPRNRSGHLSKNSSKCVFFFFVSSGTDVWRRMQIRTVSRGNLPKIFLPDGVSSESLTSHNTYLSSTCPLHLESFTGNSRVMFFDGNSLTPADKLGVHKGARVTAYEYTHNGVSGFMVCRGLSDDKFDNLAQLKKALDEKVKLYESSKATCDAKN